MATTDVGLWLIGARGNIAVTTMVGARALARGEIDATGLVTDRDPYAALDLHDPDQFVFGGHDVHTESVPEVARQLQADGGLGDENVLGAVEEDLEAIDGRIEPGTVRNCGSAVRELAEPGGTIEGTAAEVVERLRRDLGDFASEHGLDEVVVVNVASTEPPMPDPGRFDGREALERAIETDQADLPASTLYAYAALVEGYPYANFTPSTGTALGGTREVALEEGVPHMGNDGKTGESLVKAALAPMFAGRNLRVRSWEAHNILGNTDGQVLRDDRNKEGKLQSKAGILESILPELEHNSVRIDHTPSLGDWKTAWDHVHFDGFLDTEMTMQFTWQGSDSALAAPLVLDLARLLEHAHEHGEAGLQHQLASFFKAPLEVEEHALTRQFDMLSAYVDEYLEPADAIEEEIEHPAVDD